MRIFLLVFTLCGSAQSAPLVQPQDITTVSNSTFSFPGGVSVGTNTNSSALTVYGIVTSSTPIPSISCSAGTGVMAASATSSQGSFVAGTAATSCTVTFVKAFPRTPVCIVGEGTSLVTTRVSAVSATAFTAAGTTISGDTIYYLCMGAP